jgi:hypothetical protein
VGILKSSAFWATDLRYLNDSLELKYAWDKFLSNLEERQGETSRYSDAYAAQLQAIRNGKAEDLASIQDTVFVTCLSEHRDRLSQWTLYAANGRGWRSDSIARVSSMPRLRIITMLRVGAWFLR